MVGLCWLAISRASPRWSPCPWVSSRRSQPSTFFRCSGAAGLVVTQASTRMLTPSALRTCQVPCPTQVKLTCSFSAMSHLLPAGMGAALRVPAPTPQNTQASALFGRRGCGGLLHPFAGPQEVDEALDRRGQALPAEMDDVPLAPDRETLHVKDLQ